MHQMNTQGKPTSHKCITCTICVNNVLRVDLQDREGLHFVT